MRIGTDVGLVDPSAARQATPDRPVRSREAAVDRRPGDRSRPEAPAGPGPFRPGAVRSGLAAIAGTVRSGLAEIVREYADELDRDDRRAIRGLYRGFREGLAEAFRLARDGGDPRALARDVRVAFADLSAGVREVVDRATSVPEQPGVEAPIVDDPEPVGAALPNAGQRTSAPRFAADDSTGEAGGDSGAGRKPVAGGGSAVIPASFPIEPDPLAALRGRFVVLFGGLSGLLDVDVPPGSRLSRSV